MTMVGGGGLGAGRRHVLDGPRDVVDADDPWSRVRRPRSTPAAVRGADLGRHGRSVGDAERSPSMFVVVDRRTPAPVAVAVASWDPSDRSRADRRRAPASVTSAASVTGSAVVAGTERRTARRATPVGTWSSWSLISSTPPSSSNEAGRRRRSPPSRTSLRRQVAARLAVDDRADLLDHGTHVCSAGAVTGLDEVGVLVGHERPADAEAAQAQLVDELRRRQLARDRVDEHRSAVLPAGLMLTPPADDLGQMGLRRRGVAVTQAEVGLEHDLVVGKVAGAESQTERSTGCHRSLASARSTSRPRRGRRPCRSRARQRSSARRRRRSRARRPPTRSP